MRLDLTSPARPAAQPYVNHLAATMGEVLPAVVAWRERRDHESRLMLEQRIYELEHACQMCRRALK